MDWDFKKEEINLLIKFPAEKQFLEINRKSECGSVIITHN
jgi:hypothetical protein